MDRQEARQHTHTWLWTLGVALVVVTHELASIFAIADDSVFLDTETKTMLARGAPRRLLQECDEPRVIEFLTRGEGRPSGAAPG